MHRIYSIPFLGLFFLFLALSSQAHGHDWGKAVAKKYKIDLKNYRNKFPKKHFNSINTKQFILLVSSYDDAPLMVRCISYLTGKLPVDPQVVKNSSFAELEEHCKNQNRFLRCTINDLLKFGMKQDFQKIVLIRDPRDQNMTKILAHGKGNQSPPGIKPEDWKRYSMNEKIYSLLLQSEIENNPAITRSFYSEKNLIIKFEEFVTLTPGRQKQNIQKIAAYLDIQLNPKQMTFMLNKVYNENKPAVRKEKMGIWKNYFNSDHKRMCKQIMGDYLMELGYEKSLYW